MMYFLVGFTALVVIGFVLLITLLVGAGVDEFFMDNRVSDIESPVLVALVWSGIGTGVLLALGIVCWVLGAIVGGVFGLGT